MTTRQRTKYKGEWCRSLYSEDNVTAGQVTRGIPVFDIELPPSSYDEGVRKTAEEITNLRAREGYEPRPYKPEIVGTGSVQQRPFFRYLDNSESPNQDRYGKLRNATGLYTFYELIEKYYSERDNKEYEY